MKTITINKKEFPIRLGLNAVRITCNNLDIELDDFNERLTKMTLKKLKIKDLEFIANIVIGGISDGLRKEGKPQEHGLAVDDIIDTFQENPEQLSNVFAQLGESMPDAETKKISKNAQSLKENKKG